MCNEIYGKSAMRAHVRGRRTETGRESTGACKFPSCSASRGFYSRGLIAFHSPSHSFLRSPINANILCLVRYVSARIGVDPLWLLLDVHEGCGATLAEPSSSVSSLSRKSVQKTPFQLAEILVFPSFEKRVERKNEPG